MRNDRGSIVGRVIGVCYDLAVWIRNRRKSTERIVRILRGLLTERRNLRNPHIGRASQQEPRERSAPRYLHCLLPPTETSISPCRSKDTSALSSVRSAHTISEDNSHLANDGKFAVRLNPRAGVSRNHARRERRQARGRATRRIEDSQLAHSPPCVPRHVKTRGKQMQVKTGERGERRIATFPKSWREEIFPICLVNAVRLRDDVEGRHLAFVACVGGGWARSACVRRLR